MDPYAVIHYAYHQADKVPLIRHLVASANPTANTSLICSYCLPHFLYTRSSPTRSDVNVYRDN